MTATTSRRAVLAGAAAIPALSFPAVAAALNFPELTARFEAIYARWLKQYTEDHAQSLKYRAAL